MISFPHSIKSSFCFFLPLFFPGFLVANPGINFIVFTPMCSYLWIFLSISSPCSWVFHKNNCYILLHSSWGRDSIPRLVPCIRNPYRSRFSLSRISCSSCSSRSVSFWIISWSISMSISLLVAFFGESKSREWFVFSFFSFSSTSSSWSWFSLVIYSGSSSTLNLFWLPFFPSVCGCFDPFPPPLPVLATLWKFSVSLFVLSFSLWSSLLRGKSLNKCPCSWHLWHLKGICS